MGPIRAWVLLLITMSVSNGDLVTLKGYDLVYKPANSDAPRALLVNEKGNPVQSVATAAFTACLFAQLDRYNGLTDVYLFSFSSQRNDEVDEIVMRLDYLHNQTSLYIHGSSSAANVVLPLDEWMHICVSWESRRGGVDLHVNGVRVGNGGPVQAGYILGVEGYFILGQDQDSFNGDFYPDSGVHGKITEFNLWNRVLTTIEVKEVQTCKLEGNVVSWSDSYWSLEGSLNKQKSVHTCGTSISQGCECVKSAKEEFQNLLQTYKAEFQDELKKTAQTINDIEKTDGRAQQAITELTQLLESNENDIISLKNATLFLELRRTKNELEVCHQKEAIDECKQRVNSLDQRMKSEILVQKQATCEYEQRVKSIDQNLKKEILVQKQAIDEYGQRVNNIDQNLKKEILVQKQAIDEYGQRVNNIDQNLQKEILVQKQAIDEYGQRVNNIDQNLQKEILVQKQAIDEYGQRVNNIDQNLQKEILVQKQAIDEYGQRVNNIDQNLQKEILVQKQAIDEYGQRVNNIDQNLQKEILVQKQAIDECDKRLSSLDQSLKSEISSLIAEIKAIKRKTNVFACPTQFINLNGQCYYFSTHEADWDQALKDCQTLDSRASLATVETSEEWSAIKTHIDQESNVVWWIGGTDTQSEGNWIWTSTNQPLSFDAWCPGEPNNAFGNEGCLVIEKSCWNDRNCSDKFVFICKIGETTYS